MWTFEALLLLALCNYASAGEDEEPVLYYYGLEESERGLPVCAPRQACSAYLRRYWRAPALLRLCRCARRTRCNTRASPASRIELNNRAHFQFCHPVTDWPVCAIGETPVTVETSSDHLNPDELDKLHHKNIQLVPPKIIFHCQCRQPNHWKLSSDDDSQAFQSYQCTSLPLCKSGDFCGNVNYDMNSLYQSCLCPKNHICVHSGGVTHLYISELLYRGKGWRAYCQRISEDSYEDY